MMCDDVVMRCSDVEMMRGDVEMMRGDVEMMRGRVAKRTRLNGRAWKHSDEGRQHASYRGDVRRSPQNRNNI